ncbi:MAG: E3 binding domain-containing protein, partial [Trueperaceae bacterium]
MSDIDISPLAKRLADENNVDWRTLHGTGDNGRVVERDVLDYLARVMAGDEDLDPTPEPLPAGMESWSDQETFAGGDSTWVGTAGDGGSSSEGSDTVWADPEEELLDQDVSADSPDTQGVDQGETGSEAETGWFTETDGTGDRPGDTGSDPIGAEPAFELEPDTGSDSDTDIDEDIFVFEDEPAGRAAPAERADDGGSWADDVAGFGERSGESTSSDFAGDDFFALDSEEQTDPNAGDGRGFSWGEPESAAPTGTDSGLTGPGLTSSEPT